MEALNAREDLKTEEQYLVLVEEQKIVRKRIFYPFIKRFSDIFLSIIALLVLWPVFAVTAIAIKIEDGGPVFYIQERNGLNGKVFRMYKFRSMILNAEKLREKLAGRNEMDGPAFKIKHDPRVTKVGRFIRKTSIDELPQLLNIIRGDMSIVGPRPLVTYETDKCNAEQKQRMAVKPGLTCYWQVNGRSNLSFEEWVEMDLKYIEDAGVWTDFKLVLKTFKVVFKSDGAW